MSDLVASIGERNEIFGVFPCVFIFGNSILPLNYITAGLSHKARAPDIYSTLAILEPNTKPTICLEVFYSCGEGSFELGLLIMMHLDHNGPPNQPSAADVSRIGHCGGTR